MILLSTDYSLNYLRFLLARLHIGALTTKHNRKALRSTLNRLPRELDGTYEQTLQRIYEQNKDDVSLAEKTLSWVAFTLRPLTVPELQHAIATMYFEDEDDDVFEDDLPDEEVLLAVCAGLLTIDAESNLVRLVHFTAQEYFERNRFEKFPSAQASILMTCITYLSLRPFNLGPCNDAASLRHRLDHYPLLEYAALNWGNHACGSPEEEFRDDILRFLGSKIFMASACQAACLHEHYGIYDRYPRDVPEVVTVAKFGLTKIFNHLQAERYTLDASDSNDMTAL